MHRDSLPWVVAAIGFATLACTGEPGPDNALCDADANIETMTLTSDRDGYVEIPITLDADDVSLQVVVTAGSGYVSTEMLVDGNGDTVVDWKDWANSNDSLTDAFYASEDASTLNWPVRESDASLFPGDWTAYASTLDKNLSYSGQQAVDVTVIRRSCLGEASKLKAVIAYAGNLSSDSTVQPAIEAATVRWAEIYANAGITLDYSFADVDMNASLPEPAKGSAAYATLYDELGGEGIVLVVGDDLDGIADLYGEAGGIPGPQVATPRSVVALAWLIHAGANATFNDAELELMAETMAHEAGHYLGLYHPVEQGWSYWDALSDTSNCQSTGNCERDLGDNLMFPYPLCTGSGCVEQSVLSSQQAGVVRNYVGVR